MGWGMAMTSGVFMNGVPWLAIAVLPCADRFWSRMAPHELAAGDQMTGLGPSACSSVQPSVSSCMAPPDDLLFDLHDDALVAGLGLAAVERLGQLGEQVDLLGRGGDVDHDAVARVAVGHAELVGALDGVARRRSSAASSATASAATTNGRPRRRRADPGVVVISGGLPDVEERLDRAGLGQSVGFGEGIG